MTPARDSHAAADPAAATLRMSIGQARRRCVPACVVSAVLLLAGCGPRVADVSTRVADPATAADRAGAADAAAPQVVWFRFDYPHVTVFATDPVVAEEVARETLSVVRTLSRPPEDGPFVIVLPLDAPLPVTPRQVVKQLAEETDDPNGPRVLLEADRELRRQLRGVPEDVLDRIPFAVSSIPFPAAYVASQMLDFDVRESPALIPYATNAQIRALFERGCQALARRRPVKAWLAGQLLSWRDWAAWRDGMLRLWWGEGDGPAGR